MEWFVLVLAAGGGAGAYGAQRFRANRADRREKAVQLDGVRRLADEDVTVFGEQLQRLGNEVAERELDSDTRQDYQVALNAYERAKWDAPRLQEIEEISSLVDTLAAGRYALACVQARIVGEPIPELRVPCFFNPQHGPSARTVLWTSARTGTRRVPACSRCAAQVAAREKPEVRIVEIGGRRVPYWEAGSLFHPYSRGYFPEGSALSATMAWMYVQPDWGSVAGGGFSGGAAGDYGGFEGGGFDFGGGGDGGGGL
ncbi:MAG: hypothetical protein ACXWDM_09480 [Nocardioides sp.]